MANLIVHVLSRPEDDEAILLWPEPANDGIWSCTDQQSMGLHSIENIGADNSSQQAYLGWPNGDDPIAVSYEFEAQSRSLDSDYWLLQDNKHTNASVDLVQQVTEWIGNGLNQQQQLDRLIANTAELFSYGHIAEHQRFTDGKDQVPSLCGVTAGSCVDINTFLIAAAKSLGIKVQYLAGYWFHPSRNYTKDMHCWLDFKVDGEHQFWDVAHHLKWGVKDLASGLNPAGGRRWLMSYGRGLEFATPHGLVSVSHFAEPVWILANGQQIEPELHIELQE